MSQTPPPMRVLPIEYETPLPPRPGVLSAVGIVSIVIATLGTVLGCSGIASMIAFGVVAAVRPPRTIPTTAPTTSVVVPMRASTSSAGVTTFSYSATSSSRINRTAFAMFYGTAGVCNLGLAIFLSICGILVLRGSPLGRKLHLTYAVMKIPVALAEAASYMWMMSNIFTVLPNSGSMSMFVFISAAVQCAFGCAYPIALLIVMNRPAVKEYYQTRF
jgi:hypothetical protein